MKIKISELIVNFLADHGVSDAFMVTGGGAMHLDDSFGHSKRIHCTFNHHEQACAIAAEGYARLSGRMAAVCVTSGPGGTNAITGVMGSFLDSIPMFVISGQVKRETTIYTSNLKLRQLGDQEFDIVGSVKNMTKFAKVVMEPNEILFDLEKAWFLANSGRKGPVWLDVPLDVQASIVETDKLAHFDESSFVKEMPTYDERLNPLIFSKIRASKRPVILFGEGIRLSNSCDEALKMASLLKIPVVTAWNAHDEMADDNPCYCGRPGTVGTRGGNFVVQNSDLLIVLGCRLNIRQISYNYTKFAKSAYKIMVDIDKNELFKKTLSIDLPINADLACFLKSFCSFLENNSDLSNLDFSSWLSWSRSINAKYPACKNEFKKVNSPMNPYAFLDKFFDCLSNGDVVVTGNGAACVMTFQAAKIKQGQRLFTNSGCAAMGYGFPASIGACIANKGRRVVCIDGDGSFQMNIQELQTVIYNNLNLKIIYFNNNGYLSIKQTQTNLFKPPLFGCTPGSGLSFPDMSKVAPAYGLPYFKIKSLNECKSILPVALIKEGPVFIEAMVDPSQNFEPKLSSKVLPDGKIVSPDIDDMYPFLSRDEYLKNHFAD